MQKNRNNKLIFSMLLCAFSAAGCVTQYKDIMQDKTAYLQSNFTPEKAVSSVIATIKAKDSQPIAFTKVVYKIIPHSISSSSNDSDKIEHLNITTVNNVGGPFMNYIEEDTVNGVVSRTSFGLNYRGLVSLRTQYAQPGRPVASFIWEVKDYSDFSNLKTVKVGSELSYAFTNGNEHQIANFNKGKVTCNATEEFPAVSINAKLTGNAMRLKCKTFDSVNVVVDSFEQAYLESYGFTIPLKHNSSTFTTSFEFQDIQFL